MTPDQYDELLKWRESVDSQLTQLHGGFRRVSDTIDLNTNITLGVKETLEKLAADLGTLPEFLADGRTSIKFLARLVKIARWVIYYFIMPTASALAAIYFYKHGFFPAWFENLMEFVKELGGWE